MATWLIFLRGVTPSGRNKVLMAPLRTALEAAGFARVRTYIQSGNVVAESRLGQRRVEALVHEVIATSSGGDIPVLARTPGQVQAILERNPFAGADPAKTFMTLLSDVPEPERVREFLAVDYAPDRVAVVGDTVYGLVADGFSTFKANNNYIERRLRVTATTRVSNTMVKMLALGLAT